LYQATLPLKIFSLLNIAAMATIKPELISHKEMCSGQAFEAELNTPIKNIRENVLQKFASPCQKEWLAISEEDETGIFSDPEKMIINLLQNGSLDLPVRAQITGENFSFILLRLHNYST
jgi:hypothetical protein